MKRERRDSFRARRAVALLCAVTLVLSASCAASLVPENPGGGLDLAWDESDLGAHSGKKITLFTNGSTPGSL